MSRKPLPKPKDPLARMLFAPFKGETLETVRRRLLKNGMEVPVRTLQHWRAGRKIHRVYRQQLARRLPLV